MVYDNIDVNGWAAASRHSHKETTDIHRLPFLLALEMFCLSPFIMAGVRKSPTTKIRKILQVFELGKWLEFCTP